MKPWVGEEFVVLLVLYVLHLKKLISCLEDFLISSL